MYNVYCMLTEMKRGDSLVCGSIYKKPGKHFRGINYTLPSKKLDTNFDTMNIKKTNTLIENIYFTFSKINIP